MKYAIEREIRRLYKADSRLNNIKLFFIGEPIDIGLSDFPAIIIFMTEQVPFAEESGIWVYRYRGYVACETALQDNYNPEDREVDVESVLSIRSILDVASQILESNLSLGSLVENTERVRVLQLERKVYSLTNRDNNFLNRGDFNLFVETQRLR